MMMIYNCDVDDDSEVSQQNGAATMKTFEKMIVVSIGIGMITVFGAQCYRYGQRHPGTEFEQTDKAMQNMAVAYDRGFKTCQEQF